MATLPEPAWTGAVEEANWIGERLAPFDAHVVTSVVPRDFEAYARVLHPAEAPHRGHGSLVRWSQVAVWSAMPLRPDAQFHSVALPPERPEGDAPWRGQGPEQGTLYGPDAQALAEILRGHTAIPERCWFCLWDGYGWETATFLTRPGEAAARPPDPIPAAVRRGPRVRLPGRDYLLYAGPVEAVTDSLSLGGQAQTPNLWWPADRAWCVASEIDLAWTYVGGPAKLVEALLADERIEALPASPDDSLTRVEDWVARWVEEAMPELLRAGEATIVTSRGCVRAKLQRPGRFRPGALRTQAVRDNGGTSGELRLDERDGEGLHRDISRSLTMTVIELVGG